jgi:predicted nuclease with TOPRIM domain
LLHTAADVPQAAADVIAQLRQEMTRLGERDTQALAERAALTERLASLLDTVHATTTQQRDAIHQLVQSATQVLEHTATRLTDRLTAHTAQVDDVATRVTASAVELASLGEAFQHGMAHFSASNQQLAEALQRVEAAMAQSLARSDEQLAYYVAQAREVIDLSISAQQGIVEDLRRLKAQPAPVPGGA